MANRENVDEAKLRTVLAYLQKQYPVGETAFPTLAPTLRYIADLMDETCQELGLNRGEKPLH